MATSNATKRTLRDAVRAKKHAIKLNETQHEQLLDDLAQLEGDLKSAEEGTFDDDAPPADDDDGDIHRA